MIVFIQLFALIIVGLSIVNLLRMTMFLIGSDIYSLHSHIKLRKKNCTYFPSVSVVIPAFNEEQTIIHCVSSVFENEYPHENLQVVVVDDGSSDKTFEKLQEYHSAHSYDNLVIVSQSNGGKANALNNGIKNYASGELVMCLDADSFLTKDAIAKAVQYFENEKVVALASNVKIAKTAGFLNLIQRFEYIVSYQMKRAQTQFNIEYIIGGIGSTFRKSFLKSINYYDTDTVTEDIDLTMKILQQGNKEIRVIYGADVISYTQSALTIRDLIRQRYRWKWGRYQTFLKNRNMFFSRKKYHTKGLTWFYLPYALFSDATFLLEPLVVSFILITMLIYHDPLTVVSAASVISFYIIMNILSEDTIPFKDKLKLIAIAPTMYVFFYVLSFVEYSALIKSVVNLHTLPQSISAHKSRWETVKRHEYSSFTPAFEEVQ